MSNRFPPLAPQSRTRAKARILTIPDAPSLPWLELCLGFAVLLLLRGV